MFWPSSFQYLMVTFGFENLSSVHVWTSLLLQVGLVSDYDLLALDSVSGKSEFLHIGLTFYVTYWNVCYSLVHSLATQLIAIF